jgi:peptidoglycan hydrolase-like protein with peptidoglycan-binding domain
MFDSFPSYDRYRTLRLASPIMKGEDVFALQTALKFIGNDPGTTDGVFGAATDRAVRAAQTFYEIVVDGLAGGTTQTWLCRSLAAHFSAKHNLPKGLLIGQITHESGCRVGNYSPQRADSTYDAGVAQRNTAHTPARDGFNAPPSIDALGINERKYYDKYAGVKDVRRRWMLAAGAWNAPAYASFIANEEGAHVPRNEIATVGPTARFTLERYMTAATLLLEL